MDNTQPMSFPGMNPQPGAMPSGAGGVPTPMNPQMSGDNPMTNIPTQPGGIASQGRQVIDRPVKKDVAGLVKTIVIVVLSLISITFIGLFIWMFIRFDEVQTNVNEQISVAVADAKVEQADKDEQEFLQREKYPFRTFKGPADYGELTFEYPKTWSVYVESDAAKGGDFKAYLNPIEVNTVSDDTINALRVSILNTSFDEVAQDYQDEMERRGANLRVESVTFNGITGNRYTGTIPDTELSGFIVIFKIRDKTAILQTDSVLFENDFNTLLETVRFNA